MVLRSVVFGLLIVSGTLVATSGCGGSPSNGRLPVDSPLLPFRAPGEGPSGLPDGLNGELDSEPGGGQPGEVAGGDDAKAGDDEERQDADGSRRMEDVGDGDGEEPDHAAEPTL